MDEVTGPLWRARKRHRCQSRFANDANRAKLEKDVAALAKLMTPRSRAWAKPKPAEKRRKPSNDELF